MNAARNAESACLQRPAPRWLAALALVAASAPAIPASHVPHAAVSGAEPRVAEFAIPGALAPRDPFPHSAGGVYFSMSGADKIVRFDATGRQFREWSVPAGAKPHGVVVGSDGIIFYAGFGDGSLGELDPRTGVVRRHRLSIPDPRPYSLTLDAQGNPWFTLRGGAIGRLDRATGKITEYAMDGEPYGLAFDQKGILWVTCIAGDQLRRFDPKAGTVSEVVFSKGSKPRRLSIGADGKVWVSLYGTGRLVAVDAVTNQVAKDYSMPGGPNSGPYSVNVGPGGRVWVTQFQSDSIAVLDPVAGTFKVIPLTARSGIRNASMDASGRYWFISSATGRIGVVE